jgi:cation transport ATPase
VQEILIYLLVPIIIGVLTISAWLLSYWHQDRSRVHRLALLATLLGGWQRFLAALSDIANRTITVNVFVTVAISITLAIGEFVPQQR